MAQRRTSTERLGSFSDGVFTVVITIMVLELKPPEHPTFAALSPLWPTALSYVVSYYFIVYCDCLAESPLPVQVLPACDAAPHLDKLRTPIHGVAGAVLDGVGRGHQIGGGSSVRLCGGFRTRQPGVHPIRVACVGFGLSEGDFGSDATIRKSAFVSDIGNLHCCDAGMVSFEPDIVSVQLDGTQLHLEPGQTVIPHGPDRELTVAEASARR